MSQLSESWAQPSATAYLEAQHAAFRRDPSSVHVSWRSYFTELDRAGSVAGGRVTLPFPHVGVAPPGTGTAAVAIDNASDVYKLSLLIRSYQVRGHRLASLDPLGLMPRPDIKDLDPSFYGFTEADMQKEFDLAKSKLISGFLAGSAGKRSLGDIFKRLQQTYAGRIGYEYMHIQELAECNWLREQIETESPVSYSRDERLVILNRLSWAESFEKYLALKYPTSKRFGLEGGESLIPGVKAMIDLAADLGVKNVVLGMPHRGRLSTLATVLRKPIESILAEFAGKAAGATIGSGDVKYHLGTSCVRTTRRGKEIFLSLMANPSHLEAVNPLVMGKARAKQDELGDTEGNLVLPVLFHGDAAFAGQGVVYECLNFLELEGYRVGGTIHVVVNNQVGFTTDPRDARSSPYCTAVAKSISAPVFHVNGDHPEDVVRCFELAARYRQRFHKDVVIDLVCYRRYGHNETDQPAFTQPLLYAAIANKPTTFEMYSKQLVREQVLTQDELKAQSDAITAELDRAFELAKTFQTKESDWLCSKWEGFLGPTQLSRIQKTGVPQATLIDLGLKLSKLPAGFAAHKGIVKLLEQRRAMFAEGRPLDWATAELLAYATLLVEGNRVRLSGQDVQRGTFSHRHCVLTDQATGAKHNLLTGLSPDQARFYAYNSALSEFGVLGFELGYSLESPNQLVLWEAQFGDFANSAQVIIDQFIASGETKWLRQTNLTLLLPHGYDGQGPEHSSARIERYLQLVDSDPFTIPKDIGTDRCRQVQEGNLQVVVPSTPANMFHLLRRQVHRKFRKPLVCISPKNLLRLPACTSPLTAFDDIEESSVTFQRVIGETSPACDDAQVRRVIFCSGKIYYELAEERQNRRKEGNAKDVVIVRVEQLAPFPFDLVAAQCARYRNAEPVWVQEEPLNAGAYGFVSLHFLTAIGRLPRYIGRPSSAATASGSLAKHLVEQAKVIKDAFA